MPTDLEMSDPSVYRALKAEPKPELVQRLIDGGVLYPERRDLLRLPKEELIRMVMGR